MIEKLILKEVMLTWDAQIAVKINEIIDYVNYLEEMHELVTRHRILAHSKPVGQLSAKLEMHKATLQDLEEEIRKGSI